MSNQASKGQDSQPFKAGDILENFGAIVRVEEVTADGLKVVIIPAMRGGVAQGGVGQRYVASPDKCRVPPRAKFGFGEIVGKGNGLVFFVRNGNVFRASVDAVIMPDGYPCGRWESTVAHWERFRENFSWAPPVFEEAA